MAQRVNTTGAVGTALDSSMLNMVYFMRLDVVGDPLYAWTGYGDMVFGAGATGDSGLDGTTFNGITHLIAEINAIQDSKGGSSSLEIVIPGVDLTDEAMRQVVYNRNKWQFKPGRVWMAFLNDNGALIGTPIRLKSGRMDQMIVEETDDGEGRIRCVIESQQSYSGEALNTRYSEQQDLDPTDNSQQFVWQLANMTPGLGQANNPTASAVATNTASIAYQVANATRNF